MQLVKIWASNSVWQSLDGISAISGVLWKLNVPQKNKGLIGAQECIQCGCCSVGFLLASKLLIILKKDPFKAEQIDARKHKCNARNYEVQTITQSLQRTNTPTSRFKKDLKFERLGRPMARQLFQGSCEHTFSLEGPFYDNLCSIVHVSGQLKLTYPTE